MLLRRRIDIPASLTDSVMASAVPADELEILIRRGTTVGVDAGAPLINEDTFGREFLVILEGSVQVSRDDEPVAELGAGSIVGEIALLENTRRNATVTSLTSAKVLAFNRREFVTVMDECPAFAAFVVATARSRQAA